MVQRRREGREEIVGRGAGHRTQIFLACPWNDSRVIRWGSMCDARCAISDVRNGTFDDPTRRLGRIV